MRSEEIREKFLRFFEERGHTVVPSSSLVPDDPSVLLTTAGMQQFKLYYTGDADPLESVHSALGRPLGSKNAVSIQKSFRTSDIEEVGDASHDTFFEMLGNFSFGGYFKKEAILYAYDFIVKEMGLTISYVTIFQGKEGIGVPKDTESAEIWKSLDPNLDIREEGMEDVFWGPTGSAGPCGPTTEVYCKNAEGKDIEIWNIVFNEFFFNGSREELLSGNSGKKLEKLKTPGVDTGMGFERLIMVDQKKASIFETDLFASIVEAVQKSAGKMGNTVSERIVADHYRAAIFLIADGITPSNTDRGYILRRLLRRAIRHAGMLGAKPDVHERIFDVVAERIYHVAYPNISEKRNDILNTIWAEWEKFSKTLERGFKEIEKTITELKAKGERLIPPAIVFGSHQSTGVTIDILNDIAKTQGLEIDMKAFEEDMRRHQEISRAGQEKKFGGHGLILDTGEIKAGNEEELKKVTRLHTATHMLQRALREVLGPEVHQAGSDITAERTRFDFSFPRKLTPEEVKKVEDLVNEKVKEDLPMQKVVLPKNEAEKTGALYFFKEKYPDPVNIYFVGKDLESAWSKEFCGGPHVTHTGEIGEFKIAKEEAVAAGVRRIRAKVKP